MLVSSQGAACHGGRIPVLVLTRRANQSIMIGNDVVVTVLEVRGDQVRLGIKAPRSIDVHREEIFVQLQQQNRDAVAPSDNGREPSVAAPSTESETRRATVPDNPEQR
jgi:carbon storage regulator